MTDLKAQAERLLSVWEHEFQTTEGTMAHFAFIDFSTRERLVERISTLAASVRQATWEEAATILETHTQHQGDCSMADQRALGILIACRDYALEFRCRATSGMP